MTALKVWNGVSWSTVRGVAGPQGPQGPQGSGAPPSGPAGGALTGTYPNPGISRIGSGGLIAVQRDWGGINQYKAATNGGYVLRDNSNPLWISYTPTVACWWDVSMCLGIVQKMDAAYAWSYLVLTCSPGDVDGRSQMKAIDTQHSAVQTFEYRAVSMTWRLEAGTPYTAAGITDLSGGGSWQYHQAYPYLWIEGRVFAQ